MARTKPTKKTTAAVATLLTTRAVSDGTLQRFAHRVNQHVFHVVEDFISAGKVLIEAKEKVGHGQFKRLFNDHPQRIEHPIPFGARHAERLMSIARHKELRKATSWSHLPHSSHALFTLARLPAPVVQEAIARRLIHPDMTAADAQAIKGGPRTLKPTTRHASSSGFASEAEIQQEIRASLRSLWTSYPEQRGFIVETVQALQAQQET